MKYNPKIHHRRSIRLKGYDYSQVGLYFITLCIQDRKEIFGIIENGEMILNIFGNIIEQEWQKTKEIRKNCTLGNYIIMPNHFHAILSIDYQIKKSEHIGEFKSPSQTIGAIIRGFKGAATKRIKEIIINNSIISTGELQFAPTPTNSTPTNSAPNTGEFKFVPTTEIINFIKTRIELKKSIWQRDYWEHIIRDERAYNNIDNYIINNPKKWQEDTFNKK